MPCANPETGYSLHTDLKKNKNQSKHNIQPVNSLFYFNFFQIKAKANDVITDTVLSSQCKVRFVPLTCNFRWPDEETLGFLFPLSQVLVPNLRKRHYNLLKRNNRDIAGDFLGFASLHILFSRAYSSLFSTAQLNSIGDFVPGSISWSLFCLYFA